VFGWFDPKIRKAKQARAAELQGRLDDATRLYVEAEQAEEAARVLLLKADATGDGERRMALAAQAARIAPGTKMGHQAARRHALMAFDCIREAPGGVMPAELRRVAEALGASGAWRQAAEAYQLLGDRDGEIDALREAGELNALERRLAEDSAESRTSRNRAALLAALHDHDQLAERRAALCIADTWLSEHDDEQVRLEKNRIVARLLTGPRVTLEIDGERQTIVLGQRVTVGRSGADVTVASTAVSRQHLCVFRRDDGCYIEDLDTRNGTLLAGARVSGVLPVGEGLELALAGEIRCVITPLESRGGVLLEVAGEQLHLPLGPLQIGDWRLFHVHDGDHDFVVLRTRTGVPPLRDGYSLCREIELCHGDALTRERDGAVILAVPAVEPT